MAAGAETRIRADVGGSYVDPDATSLQAGMGFNQMTDLSGGLRIMTDGAQDDLRYALHLNLAYQQGDSVALAGLLPAGAVPPASLLDLTQNVGVGSRGQMAAQIDRAWVSYTTDRAVVKLGRQAITWGNGLVFHPGDIVAPFSPNALDTSHKPGVEMVYGQYLFDSGADVQAIYVPRPAVAGSAVDPDSSTIALRGFSNFGPVDASVLWAQDRGDRALAVGLSGALGGAGWKAEVVDWQLATGAVDPSWVVNITNFGSLGDWGLSYFAEVYHNGFGTTPGTPVDVLPAALAKRMATGQVFYGGTDYVALGAQLLISPEFSLAPSAIISATDGSKMLTLAGNLNLGDNSDLSFAAFAPIGADGSDFGGRETSAGSGTYLGAAPGVSVKFTQYF